ncbi:DUF6037 family protein [Ancylomarina sp. DW003]|nr:DUF6037 family protein [Ancylomarina sp. DW003]MDE5422423.1 DUF6037 family protein [Ancylomarina sp. DW003]
MKLTGLVPLYRDLKNKKEMYSSFDYKTGGICFEVFFDIYETPFKLIFVVREQNYRLSIDVLQGFIINPILSKDELRALAKVLGLTYDPNNPFSPPKFFSHFNQSIPEFSPYKVPKEQVYRFHQSDIEKADRIYYKTKIEWNKLPNSKGNATPENLFKTRVLYPELYQVCKRNNISIVYTAELKERKDYKKDFKNI